MTSILSALTYFPPMGIYEVLFSFEDANGVYLGTEKTYPFAQGFPLTTRLPNGPELPNHVEFSALDMKYPSASGAPELLKAIRDYYAHFYGADISTDNIAIFAGGRPAIFAILTFLKSQYEILIEETEYTPYYDALKLLNRKKCVIPCNVENAFRPTLEDYKKTAASSESPKFLVKSNPCNPTGVTWSGTDLANLMEFCSRTDTGGIIDEAYEFFHTSGAISAMAHVRKIDDTNLFVVGAATKGLQVPGMRIGWVIASRQNIEVFRNFSSIAMGGVSRPAQIYVAKLLELKRAKQARSAVANYYNAQRERYAEALDSLGLKLYSGNGGFYHWCKIPGGLRASELNRRLFEKRAAILPGYLCDMHRRGNDGPHGEFFRFSFGAIPQEEFEKSIEILKSCL